MKRNLSGAEGVPPGCEAVMKAASPIDALAKVTGLTRYDVALCLGYRDRRTEEPNRQMLRRFFSGWLWPSEERMLALRQGFRQAQVPEMWITFAVARQYAVYIEKGGRRREPEPPTVKLNA